MVFVPATSRSLTLISPFYHQPYHKNLKMLKWCRFFRNKPCDLTDTDTFPYHFAFTRRYTFSWEKNKQTTNICICAGSGSNTWNIQTESDKVAEWHQRRHSSIFRAVWLSRWHKYLFTSFRSDTCGAPLSLSWSIYITSTQRITPLI